MKSNWYRKVMYKTHPINITEWKLIDEELAELERLADIGRATELAYEKEFCITNNGWQEIYLDTVEELLEWAKEQTK